MRLSFRKLSPVAGYALGAGLAVASVALHWVMQPLIDARAPFLFFLPSLLFATALAGRGPGLVVLATGAINGALLLPPVGSLQLVNDPDKLVIGMYLIVGLLIVVAGTRLRLITERAADAEQRLRLTQQEAGVGLFDIDVMRQTILASPTMWTLIGAQARDISVPMAQWQALTREEDMRSWRKLLQKSMDEGASHCELEFPISLPSGESRWLLCKAHIEHDEAGHAVRLRGVAVDTTARKQLDALLDKTQAELQQQVNDLQHLHELSSELLELTELPDQLQAILRTLVGFHHASLGLVSLYDPASGRLQIVASVGFKPADLARLDNMAVGEGARGVALAQRQRVVVEDTETDPRFAKFRALTRETGFRAVHSTPLLTISGEVMGVLSVHMEAPWVPAEREMRLADICARKASVFIERARARASMERSEQRFRVALESAAVPFTVLEPMRDDQGRIMDFRWRYVNTAAARVLQRPAEQVLDRAVNDVLPGSWDEPDLFAHYVAVSEQGETRQFELHSIANGIEGWFHVVASPLDDAVVVWFADVTGRKQHEQALQEADQRKDEFLATLAHELRNPLAPIRQATAISRAPGATDAQKRWSHDVIDRQVEHMALLLDDLLDVSRITRGQLQLRKAVTELSAVVEAAVETAQPVIDAKRHRLDIDLPSQPIRFEVDQMRIAQVLGNLLTNAAKYTDPEGSIRISADLAERELRIHVEDNGIGIRPQALNDIFDMFTQVRSIEDRSAGGLGIGLALSRGLVELHGGTISAHSAGPGHGSRFTVRLPLGASSAPSGDSDNSRTPEATPLSRRILIADDNRDAADSLAELLQLQGHAVHVVYDGVSAIEAFAQYLPDVALLDIGMPGRTGHEVARAIRSHAKGAAVKLVAITGWGQERDRELALKAGFDAHLTKPIHPRRLGELLAPHPVARGDAGKPGTQ